MRRFSSIGRTCTRLVWLFARFLFEFFVQMIRIVCKNRVSLGVPPQITQMLIVWGGTPSETLFFKIGILVGVGVIISFLIKPTKQNLELFVKC